jgi:aryl-alcohol dehydrogenase-like predicted oxidoreductase
MAELVLGTVQLGVPYGISNSSGKPDQRSATEIVKIAYEGGVRYFDTAQGYGDSEKVLGNALKDLGIADDVSIISKFESDVDVTDAGAVANAVNESCERLGVSLLFGLQTRLTLVEPIWGEGARVALSSLVESGLIQELGVSVYTPEQARFALEMEGINAIQLPCNIADRRFEDDGVLADIRKKGIQTYLRSVYLQGLFFVDADSMPYEMSFATSVVLSVQGLAQELGLEVSVLLLQYVKTMYPSARILLGAETAEQMKQNIDAWNTVVPSDFIKRTHGAFNFVEERILNPSLWPSMS